MRKVVDPGFSSICLDQTVFIGQPGDLQLVNNHVTYHGRGTLEDDEEGHDRLLMRLWLATPGSRPLPDGFDVLWGSTEPDALRGGIAQPQ